MYIGPDVCTFTIWGCEVTEPENTSFSSSLIVSRDVYTLITLETPKNQLPSSREGKRGRNLSLDLFKDSITGIDPPDSIVKHAPPPVLL